MDCGSIFLVASYIRFELDVGWWTWIHGGGGSSSRSPDALVGVVAPQLYMHTHVHMCGVQIVMVLAQLQLWCVAIMINIGWGVFLALC